MFCVEWCLPHPCASETCDTDLHGNGFAGVILTGHPGGGLRASGQPGLTQWVLGAGCWGAVGSGPALAAAHAVHECEEPRSWGRRVAGMGLAPREPLARAGCLDPWMWADASSQQELEAGVAGGTRLLGSQAHAGPGWAPRLGRALHSDGAGQTLALCPRLQGLICLQEQRWAGRRPQLGECENPGRPWEPLTEPCGRGAMGARRALTTPRGRQLPVRASGRPV